MADLPAGFVLDQPTQQPAGLPAGFVLDNSPSEPQQDDRNFVARYLRPRREDYPEYPIAGTPESQLEAERNPNLRQRSVGDLITGDQLRISQDQYGNDIIITPRGTFYSNKPGPSLNDIPNAGNAIFNTVKEAAPYLAGGAATAAARPAIGVGVQGLTGLATESIDQTGNAAAGKETDLTRLATTPLFAMAGDLAGRAAFAVMRPVMAKLFGSNAPTRIINENGTLTDDAIRALETVDPAQVDDLAMQELTKMQQQGVLTREQAERYNFFKNQGIEPTRAQVTRSADDFQAQQEAAKTSTSVRSALEGQDAQIANAFDTRIRGTGGNATTSGSPVADAVLNKATQLDTEISNLYRQVEEKLPAGKDIKLNRLLANIQGRAGDDQFTNGLVSSLRGYLKEIGVEGTTTGVINSQGNAARVSTTRGVNVRTAERIRQFLNSQYDSTTPYGRRLIHQLKDSIDADVTTTIGDDLYQSARAAKTNFEAGLRPTSLSKFDTNEKSLVRDILENQIKADDVFDKAVLSKSWKASDLRELKNYLTRGSQEQVQTGVQAWNDLRAESVQWIKDQVFANALDQSGSATMRAGAMRRSLDKIGPDRLSVLFTGEEREFLSTMARLEQLRQPVPGTGIGKGPSAQAIEGVRVELKRAAAKLPMVGQLIEILSSQAGARNALSTPIPDAVRAASTAAARRMVTPSGGAVGVLSGNRLIEERPE